jgi:hypothetical protein
MNVENLKQRWRENLSDWARVVLKIFLLTKGKNIGEVRDMIEE